MMITLSSSSSMLYKYTRSRKMMMSITTVMNLMMTLLMNHILLTMTIISSISLIGGGWNDYSMGVVVQAASSSSSLSSLFEEVESLLALSSSSPSSSTSSHSSSSSSDHDDNEHNHGEVDDIINTINELNNQYATIYTLLRQEHIHINEWNIQQLTTLLNQLDQYHTKHVTNNNNKDDHDETTEVIDINNNEEYVTKDEFNDKDMIKDIRHELYQDLYNEMMIMMKSSSDDDGDNNHISYIHRVIDNVVKKSTSIMNNILHHQNDDIHHDDNHAIINNNGSDDCVVTTTTNDDDVSSSSIVEAYHTIYDAIRKYNHDRIGIDDILQHDGTSIVYEMTSPTYESSMTTTTSDLIAKTTTTPMTTSWLKQYVPYDWEHYILPDGYEHMIYQSYYFILYWCDIIYESIFTSVSHHVIHSTTMTRKNAGPDIILSNNTNLGYCWPMIGGTGYITIRLPYPTYITNITIDHTLPILDNNNNKSSSALKHFQIYTYTNNDVNDGLGFDVNSKQLWKQTNPTQPFLFNITSSSKSIITSIQTFTPYDDDNNDDNNNDDDKSTVAATSVSVVAATAIQLEILDNWGNPDYTCLYRIRVHGTPAS